MSIEEVEVPLGLCGLRIFDLLEFFTLKKSQVSTFTIWGVLTFQGKQKWLDLNIALDSFPWYQLLYYFFFVFRKKENLL